MAQLKVKKELIDKDAEIAYSANGGSYIVKLAKASQDQLKVLKQLGFDVFEEEKK